MPDVIVKADLWSTRLLPEGVLTTWRVADGAAVAAGELIAEVAIEGQAQGVVAPADGILRQRCAEGDLIQPDEVIGEIP